MLDFILTEGTCWLWDLNTKKFKSEILDIGILQGKISAIGNLHSQDAAEKISAKGLQIFPGLIDTQVHFREPGMTHKEDLESGTHGALLGGFTSVFEMPNTRPPTTTYELMQDKVDRLKNRAWVNVGFYGGASPENIQTIASLENHPSCCGIKIFMGSSTGTLLLDRDEWLEALLKNIRKRAAVHAEDENRLNERKHIALESKDPRSHPVWRDEQSALLAVQRIVGLAEKTNRQVHILHVTSQDEMEFLAKHKNNASVEVTPQHLLLSAPECYDRYGTKAQMNPPIRDERHRQALWKALHAGVVDVLGSDHAPHTLEEKAKTYPESPSGFVGVQTMLTLMLNEFHKGNISVEKILELLAENPRRLFNIKNKGRIAVGADADLTIVDLNQTKLIENSWIASKCGWTLFDGMKTTGWPVHVFVNGHWAVRDGKKMGDPKGLPLQF